MSKQPSATVIAFPIRPVSVSKAVSESAAHSSAALASTVPKKPSRARQAFEARMARPGNSSPENCIEYRAFKKLRTVSRPVDPAFIVRQAIHWTRKRPIALSSLPDMIRKDLEKLCAAGDPTGLMVRDWLEGKGPKPVVEEKA
ncbi:hypothetical protein FE840_018695 (plasmid) [Peteryoungia desertarenae]|uniref:Uncharacterized protein n=1 Tax=Peteryoungia desertarenae TaxID=1813451 RepID=A0ABX6QSV7_9HYPH|nr:hypothetical protein [Peteryoungia desertarenae]QLF71676.1 hypothetical protein FE840_018695 [Peteryoungia desertarenae]